MRLIDLGLTDIGYVKIRGGPSSPAHTASRGLAQSRSHIENLWRALLFPRRRKFRVIIESVIRKSNRVFHGPIQWSVSGRGACGGREWLSSSLFNSFRNSRPRRVEARGFPALLLQRSYSLSLSFSFSHSHTSYTNQGISGARDTRINSVCFHAWHFTYSFYLFLFSRILTQTCDATSNPFIYKNQNFFHRSRPFKHLI